MLSIFANDFVQAVQPDEFHAPQDVYFHTHEKAAQKLRITRIIIDYGSHWNFIQYLRAKTDFSVISKEERTNVGLFLRVRLFDQQYHLCQHSSYISKL